jgi:hypothetical protein
VSDEPSTCEAGGKRKEREKRETIPVRPLQETHAGLTSVRVRINEIGLLVRSIVVRGNLTISMKCLGHELLRGHVQCVYRITTVPISWSFVTQAGLLENLHRLDTMIVKEVAKKGRHTITRLGARFVESRTRRAVGALVTLWSAGMVATPCSRVMLVGVSSKLAGTIVLDECERQVFVVSRSSRTLWYASRRERLVESLRVAMRTDFRTSLMDRLPM